MKNYSILSLKFSLLFVCLLGLATSAYSQSKLPELEKKFSVDELKVDYKVLRENIEKLHIGLYSYTPKAKIDKAFDEIEAELIEPLTALEFFNKFNRLNKLIGNVHTSISPPQTIWDAIKKELPLFPFDVYWNENSLYILKNLSDDDTIKEGSKIKTINGKPAGILFKELKDGIMRDGYNESYPIKRTAYSFAIIYASRVGMPDIFELELEEPKGDTRKVKITPLPADKLNANHLTRYKNPKISWEQTKDSALKLSINGDLAAMKIRTFDISLIKEKGQKWKKFFKKSFKEINKKGVNHLILDLRDNNGGQPEPTIGLLSYLHDNPFTIYRSINANVDKIPREPYIVQDETIENFEETGWVKKGDSYELKDKDEFKKQKPAKTQFRGKIYVLTNAFTNSATGTLTGQLKSLTTAIFIGQEPGGNPYQTVARQIIRLELPNSKVRVRIPLELSIKNVNFENKGLGIVPDYIINSSIEDMIKNKDSVMDFTLNLINQSSKSKDK